MLRMVKTALTYAVDAVKRIEPHHWPLTQTALTTQIVSKAFELDSRHL